MRGGDSLVATASAATAVASSWHVLVEAAGRAGAYNMAVDVALLRLAQEGDAFLRLYAWDPPCLSFGRHEPAIRRYDRERIASLGWDTVRRPTGGRAVWHDAEVTYAVAAPIAAFGSLRETYQIVHAMLAAALRTLGAASTLAPLRSPLLGPGAGACFAAPAGGEVVVGDRKLVGSAQVRERDAFLQHGSILLRDGQDTVAQVTRGPSHRAAATGLDAVTGRRVTFDEVAQAVVATARNEWAGEWRTSRAQPADLDVARFADPAWTWRR